MHYNLVSDEFGISLDPVAPNPVFAPKCGDLVRLRAPYNEDKFFPVVRAYYGDIEYRVTHVLDELRNTPTVSLEAVEEIVQRVADPFPRETQFRPTGLEIQTGYLMLVQRVEG